MIFRIYNSLSKTIEEISIPTDRPVSIYCCGVTVYDHCHVGHGRIYTLLDTLTRFLSSQGCALQVIRNITDIDDKILKRAEEEKRPWRDIAQTYAASMQKVLHHDLGCHRVPCEPRATDAITTMIAMIEKLIVKGVAYVSEGEVFFSVEKFQGYGELSGQKLAALQEGQRVAIHEGKNHPADFTLWKPSSDPQASWPSPWGPGRPGWHIECSAMIAEQVSGPLDFHLGGMDLKFPHHDNEIAQSESCSNHALARCWVHGGFVTVNQEKMSKSLKNFQYLSDLVDDIGRNATRYFYLSTHYRQPLEMTPDKIRQAQNCVRWLEQAVMEYAPQEIPTVVAYPQEIITALMHDLNTPQALTLYHEAVKSIKELPEKQRAEKSAQLYATAQDLFGFDFKKATELTLDSLPQQVQQWVGERAEAKKNKDFVKADTLRHLITQAGYQVVDSTEGVQCFPIKKS